MSDSKAVECAELNTYDKGVCSLFADIVKYYDGMNSVLSFGMDYFWRKALIRSVRPFSTQAKGVILDMAAGTLKVTSALLRDYPDKRVVAIDFCYPMLSHGMPKVKDYDESRRVAMVGDARKIPMADSCVDAITIAFGLRNVLPRRDALAEALRVLVPGGRLCILEFGSAQDKIMFGVYNIYLRYVLPFLGRVVSGRKGAYEHLADSIESFPAADVLCDELKAVGFGKVHYRKYTAGIVCLHVATKL